MVLNKMTANWPDLRSHLKSGPVVNQPLVDFSKSRLVLISDLHFTRRRSVLSEIPNSGLNVIMNSDPYLSSKLKIIVHVRWADSLFHSVRKMVPLRHFLGLFDGLEKKPRLHFGEVACLLSLYLSFLFFHFSLLLCFCVITQQPNFDSYILTTNFNASIFKTWIFSNRLLGNEWRTCSLFWSWCVERVKHYSRGSKYELVKPNTIPVPISSHFVRFSNGRGSH